MTQRDGRGMLQAVISTETAMLIAGNKNLDKSDPLLVMQTWRTTKLVIDDN